ncbi:MAG TPA: hypothetical protein DIU07_17315 [Rhodobacteraceae bacterium]|nr:hypothetical protein [Paracoccaceae bacterium]
MPGSATPAIERLLRGISTDHVETVRDAWRDLLAEGKAAVPAVRDKLDSDVWERAPRGPSGRYLGLLLAILDELDRNAFAKVVHLLSAGRLHPLHRRTVEVMAQRLSDQPTGHIGPGIPVYVAHDIDGSALVIARLARWGNTPDLGLEKVTRIDVIAKAASMDYLGLYNMLYSGIILAWPAVPRRGFLGWLGRIQEEFTFYHEVGHHACRHVEGGTVAEQEDEADDYARQMFRHAHPTATAFARGPAWVAGKLMRALVSDETLRRAGVRTPTD